MAIAAALSGAALTMGAEPLAAQDANIHRPAPELEALLARGDLGVTERRTIRPGGRPTDLVVLDFGGDGQIAAKWRRAPDGGHEWNNAPRYELAAHEIQKLFLDPGDRVIPPTALRCFPPGRYAGLAGRDDPPQPTIRGTDCVLVLLQYWLRNVTSSGVWDEERMDRDAGYARHLANLDVLTHLIQHKDANTGNFLVSTVEEGPRVFVVDNAISFDARRSPRGYEWMWLRVERIPETTATRLRSVTLEELRSRLGVLAQFEEGEDGYRAVTPTENLDAGRGIRVDGGRIQLGLTDDEIQGLHRRIRDLLQRLDAGGLATF